MIKIKFLGALNEIGNSGILIESNSEKILLDYGLKVFENPPKTPLKVENVNYILLSHSHLDHSGYITYFSKNKTKIYALRASKEITSILLRDNLKVLRKKKINFPFDENDISKIISKFRNVSYEKVFEKKSFSFKFIDAGHILGASMIELEINNKRILYTGDFKLRKTNLTFGCNFPEKNPDILIIEGTYWYKNLPERDKLEKEFINDIREVLDKDGTILLPSLAVGRSQEILTILGKYNIHKEVDIYLDGMVIEISKIYQKFENYLNEKKYFLEALKNSKKVKRKAQRKEIIMKKDPKIIICGSGMLEGGPAEYYVKKIYNNENDAIFLTCYQLEKTTGRILLETGKLITKDGFNKKVKSKYKLYEFSAHADRSELFEFIEKVNPNIVFIVHGENLEKFEKELNERGIQAIVPTYENNLFILP
ncbi:MAG: MBL fold metallo-hydrolase [Candidatus Aenigmatarchaeota archaeon]